jgi:hypothetical protein
MHFLNDRRGNSAILFAAFLASCGLFIVGAFNGYGHQIAQAMAAIGGAI